MAHRVQVKICGITSRDDALAALAAGADLLGFNFYPPSPRYLEIDAAAEIVRALPPKVKTVGVFVDARRELVLRTVEQARLTMVQFHGHESPDDCRGWPFPVIKAVRLRDAQSADEIRRYTDDFILADAYVEGQPGGTGCRIPEDLLAGVERERLFLAGGLNPENVGQAVRAIRPFAVDVASGVESAPGRKDSELMRRFVANVQSA